mgnify:CR=1 FL=1
MGGRYGHSGPGQLRSLSENPEDLEPAEPTSPDLSTGGQDPLYQCTAPEDGEECGRQFKKKMLVARHFNATHGALKEDADSWRDYYEEVDR